MRTSSTYKTKEESSAFWRYMTSFDKLDTDVQNHLKKVYITLTGCMAVAIAGSYAYTVNNMFRFNMVTMIIGLIAAFMLMSSTHKKENVTQRTGYLMTFSFCSGISLGPLLSMATRIDETIVPLAFLLTCVIFFCFTMASLKNSSERKYLYLGGTIMTLSSVVLCLTLANLFFGSTWLFEITLYAGLGMFLMYVLYDTQLIIYKCENGDRDHLRHALDLFVDFIGIFRRLVIIMSMKNEKKDKN